PNWWDLRRYFGGRVRATLEGGPIGLVLDGRTRPAAGPLSLGRESIEDDAAAARFLGEEVAVRAIVTQPSLIRYVRSIPADARVLVGPGDSVEAGELIAQARGAADTNDVLHAARLLGPAE